MAERKKTTRKKTASRKKESPRKSSATRKNSTTRKKATGRKKTTARKKSTRKYGKKSQRKVGKVMREYKHGQLKSGRSGKKVKSRKQAIAIGLSQARRAGGKVPPARKFSRKKS